MTQAKTSLRKVQSHTERIRSQASVHTASHIPHSREFVGGDRNVKFQVILTPDESGGFVVECPAIPGCFSEGDTEEEALENIKEAIAGCLEARRELNMPLTAEVREVEV